MRVATDIDRMDRFLDRLRRFDDVLVDEFKTMRAEWRGLGEVWDDDQYRKLGVDLDEAAQSVQRYLDSAETHQAYLKDLIEILRKYHER